MSDIGLPIILRPDWYTVVLSPGVCWELPGIYEWQIDGVGCYIGKYKNSSRPRREYGLNVGRLLAGKPYRKNKPTQFRAIHRALHQAVQDERTITLVILENHHDDTVRHQRERELIRERRSQHAGTGYAVLNSD